MDDYPRCLTAKLVMHLHSSHAAHLCYPGVLGQLCAVDIYGSAAGQPLANRQGCPPLGKACSLPAASMAHEMKVTCGR